MLSRKDGSINQRSEVRTFGVGYSARIQTVTDAGCP